MRTIGRESDIYGKLYAKRKAEEIAKNESGGFSELAKSIVENCPTHKQKDDYKQGKLPDSHILSRACRYVTKIFLSHWWEKAYEMKNGCKPPFQPYPFDHLGHAHKIEAPDFNDQFDIGLDEEDDVAV